MKTERHHITNASSSTNEHYSNAREASNGHIWNISLYAFWRLFDVKRGAIVRKQKEHFVALTGVGWPEHAKIGHPNHTEYCKRTLLAYMPCPGIMGTEYIVSTVASTYGGNWAVALKDFCLASRNAWCPTWILRNYEFQNDIVHGVPQSMAKLDPLVQDAPATKTKEPRQTTSTESPQPIGAIPYSDETMVKYMFEKSGEPDADASHEDRVDHDGYVDPLTGWDNPARPPWQKHSALGPNIRPNEKLIRLTPLQEVENPANHKYDANPNGVQLATVRAQWETVAATTSEYEDVTLRRENLGDDFQQLFVDILLRHVQKLLDSRTGHVPPLRLFMLGGPGTGKTKTTQTSLQEIKRLLHAAGLPASFVKVAAPTGCAAFNLRFNATTIHRLIHYLNVRSWNVITDDKTLARLQAALQHTQLIFLDEISMVGRQLMGKVDSRLQQAKAGQNPLQSSLGGISFALVGDPAQIEAIREQQMYDTSFHKDTHVQATSDYVQVSNRGLDIYAEFQEVIILQTVHRANLYANPTTDAERAYNDRGARFQSILTRLRNMDLTHDDYFWLCGLKRSTMSLEQRVAFKNKPVLMEFRRTTESNEEDNCEHFNRQKVRMLAKDTSVPVIAFDAVHDGIPQDEGLALDDDLFGGLPKRLDLAVGAPVLLIHNIAVEHGLVNGAQGEIIGMVYPEGCSPNHADPTQRMPIVVVVVVVDFPCYTGPPVLKAAEQRTWISLLPRTCR